jgi:copper(I)-binding protein
MRFSRFAALALGCLALFVAFAGTLQAKDVKVGSLVIETPWSRATPGGAKVGAGYLAIVNIGDKPDRLVSVASPIADRVEIHSMTIDGGVMRMKKVDGGLEIKAQEVTELKPGGFHIMFIGLKKPIAKGDQLPVKLTFAEAGPVDLTFVAAAIGARNPPGNPGLEQARGSRSGAPAGSGRGSH